MILRYFLNFTTSIRSSKSKTTASPEEKDVRGGMSFLKWAGGKGQIISELENRLPKKFNNYYEPFVGGASLFFNIKLVYPEKEFLISDTNEELINSFNVIKNNLDELIKELEKYKTNYNNDPKNYYYKVRDQNPKNLSKVRRAARFIFLNKTCWNGLYRVNSNGKFNVPHGKNKNPQIYNKNKLLKIRKLLNNTKILNQDFSEILKVAKEGDFVYFDPPYYPISKTSKFTDYTKSGFIEDDQKKLAEIFKKLDERGCYLMLSNSDTNFIRDLYKDYSKNIIIVKARRSINSNKNKRGPINELIIKNY